MHETSGACDRLVVCLSRSVLIIHDNPVALVKSPMTGKRWESV